MKIQASCHRSGMTNVIIPVKNNPFRSNINLEYTFTECIFTESVEILRIQPVARILGNVLILLTFTLKTLFS